ncbi:probable cytochrome P450 308a1 [Uranotaenia lowii]|uniref:probable cytochrome P450 308a1 n=1 Tax=Uranotaenia lowii TaxID=190385 RepID=UPI00247AD8A5|nr:probable cytochrome P450 308a1 [Uranotaenia lowii]XP_055611069.1 probable cytochrome P450 308a1 [Uranotaenia lowii]XP_055611071.1 probable cytochrome P450 308a1 [Uranotaenia lowii]XP_055611072.1 probable cytochrome P450 308a1 [Uranotaenia lowii]
MIQAYIALGVLAICLFFKWSCSYWRRTANIDGPQPLPIFGNFLEAIISKKHYGEIFEDIYRSYPTASWVGVYELFNKPAVLVRDLELVKDVLVSSFQHFNANSFRVDAKNDPLMARNPFTQVEDRWKELRAQIVPIFVASKVRATFPIMKSVAENFFNYVSKTRPHSPDFEAQEICAKYTLDVVSSCAFGIDAESFTSPEPKFRQMTNQLFDANSTVTWIRTFLALFAPQVASWLKLSFVPKHVDRWFRGVISEVLRQRENGTVKRSDLFQAIYDNLRRNGGKVEMDDIAGMSILFASEGFETSSITMCHFLYELASNKHIQDKVLQELDTVMKDTNGELTDEVVQKLNYMERGMYETLRLHPVTFTVSRVCTKDYELPPQYANDQKRAIVKKGMTVIIPTSAIHCDPEIFPDPYRFDPDRFLEENKDSRHRYAYLGFGEGPRICPGMKFGLTQSKIGMATLLNRYRVELAPKQELPLEFSRTSFLRVPKKGVWIRFVERK